MTNWKAVSVGLTVELFVGVVGIAIPGIGQLIAGLIGGFVAGYMASTTMRGGLWHGLLAGSLGGFLLAIPFGLVIGVASFGIGITGELGSVVAGLGTAVFTVIAAVILGANSALGGAMGAIINKRYPDLADRRFRLVRPETEERSRDGRRKTDDREVVEVEHSQNQGETGRAMVESGNEK